MTDISNTADILDVRDIIEQFEELETDRKSLTDTIVSIEEELANAHDDSDTNEIVERLDTAREALADWDDADEFKTLTDLLDDLKGGGGDEEWRGAWYPVTLVRDSYFQEYAEELANDIGAINSKQSWPNNCIDWEQAARELQIDYTSTEYDGVTYWYR